MIDNPLDHISGFIKENAPKELQYLADKPLLAWHFIRNRIVYRRGENGISAVMLFWQLESPEDLSSKVINEVEGKGNCIYIPFLAMDKDMNFSEEIGSMLEYAVDACGISGGCFAFERMDNKVRRYKIKGENGREQKSTV